VRILHVVQQLNRGGAESIVLALKGRAESLGHTVGVAAAPGDWSPAFGSPVFDLPVLHRRLRSVPAAGWALRRAVRALRPDVVHAHNPGMALVTALATGRGARPPAIVTDHGVFGVDYARVGRVLRWAGLPVVACGPAVAAALERHGCPVRTTIPNGVAPPPPPLQREQLRTELGVRADHHLVVSVGRLSAQKRHDRSIRAMAHLPQADLIILGEGEARPALEALVRDLGLTGRVHLPGNVPYARGAMGAADAVVMTSDEEGLPLALIEAMMSGTPLVATRVRGIAELVADAVTGLLVPPDDQAALVATLRRVLADGSLARRLAAGALRESAVYDQDRMLDSYLTLYQDVIAGPNQRA
jgi:glycosyltransferase involved in cell wall biosynthesis